MTAILSQNIDYIAGVTQLSATRARMELFDDRLVVTTLDDTGEPLTAVIDTPLGAIGVSGSMALLTLRVGPVTHKVDFSYQARVAMTRKGGIFAAMSLVKESGISGWLDEFRARGVVTKYTSMGQLWLWALAGSAVFAFVVFVVATNMS
jgi:hypothetical protein